MDDFFKRLVTVLLLPNILIIGHLMNGLDHNSNIAWRLFLRPYLMFELIVLGIGVFCLIVYLIYEVPDAQSNNDEQVNVSLQTAPVIVKTEVASEPLKPQAMLAPVVEEIKIKPVVVVPEKPPRTLEQLKQDALADITGGWNE